MRLHSSYESWTSRALSADLLAGGTDEAGWVLIGSPGVLGEGGRSGETALRPTILARSACTIRPALVHELSAGRYSSVLYPAFSMASRTDSPPRLNSSRSTRRPASTERANGIPEANN